MVAIPTGIISSSFYEYDSEKERQQMQERKSKKKAARREAFQRLTPF